MNKDTKNYNEFKQELLKNPEVANEYEALKPQFDMIRQYIELRNKRNISQAELAERIGTKQAAISRLERGYPNTTIGTWQNIAEALDAELEINIIPKESAKA
jgi:DNA-binding XRE family transcriptional regulator